jgi:hypothetical protein
MLLISLVQFIALFYQQQLSQYIEPEQLIEYYLTQLEFQHEIESDYYHTCGRW